MRRTLGVALVLLLFLGALSPVITADVGTENSLAVFITYPYGDYEIGSQVNVTVHVFQAGEYFDPEGVDLEIRESGKNIDLTKAATGVYTGNFVIVWEDLSDYLGVYLDANAEPISGSSVWHTVLMNTVYTRFQVSSVWLTPADRELRPGQDITLEVQATYQGEFVDPDPGSIRVHVHDHDTEGDPINLDTTRIGVGRYRTSTSLPEDATSSASFEVGASANLTITIPTAHGDEEFTHKDGGWRPYNMDPFDVWVNLKEVSREEILVDLFVRDDDDLPVVDAEVSLEFSYMEGIMDRTPIGSDDGRTDENGSLATLIDLSDVPTETSNIWVEGNVTSDGTFQEIQRILFLSEINIDGLGRQGRFDVEIIGEEMSYENGSLWLKNRATSYGDELSGSDVYVYVVSDYGVVNNSVEETDASGEFEVEFQVPELVEFGSIPSGFTTTYYHALVNGSWTSVEQTHIKGVFGGEGFSRPPDAPQTMLNVGPAVAGENLSIEFSNPLLDGVEEVATVMWGIGEASLTMGRPILRQWSRWTPLPSLLIGGYAECQWTGEGYVANVTVPDFLPVGTELSIVPSINLLDVAGEGVMGPIRWVTISEENPEPMATIIIPAEDEVVNGTITLQGTAADDGVVEKVQVRVVGGNWIDAEGTEEWTFDLDTTEIIYGNFTIQVRAFDGTAYSVLASVKVLLDNPPSVTVVDQTVWLVHEENLVAVGRANDDKWPTSVEVRIDGGEWVEETVDSQGYPFGYYWNHAINLSTIPFGDHILEVRSFDGSHYSPIESIGFFTDRTPIVTIENPLMGETHTGSLMVEGLANDDLEIVKVELRIESGNWTVVEGTEKWSHVLELSGYDEGNLTVEVRAFDGIHYSQVTSVTFTVDHNEPNPQTSGNNWLYVSIVMVVAVGIIIGVWYRGQRRS